MAAEPNMAGQIAGLRRRARGLLPDAIYAYYAGGSGRERTLRASERAWRKTWLAPRVLRDVSAVDTRVRLLGAELATPVAVAPTAFHRLGHPDGELASAAGAARAGALFVLATRATRRIEDVAQVVAAAGGSWWFQVYVLRDRELTAGLVRRAAAAGAGALVLTADTPFSGLGGPGADRHLGDGRRLGESRLRPPGAIVSDEDFLVNLGPLDDRGGTALSSAVTFADIGWLSEISGGLPVVVKGVLRPDDAVACAAAGAAAVIVSNHGGRQLDGALPAALALPAVAAALGGRDGLDGLDGLGRRDAAAAGARACQVLADGGLRSGQDVLAALALGAVAIFLGRPVLWALACGGADAVHSLLTGLTAELAHSMALAGAAALAEIPGIAAAPR